MGGVPVTDVVDEVVVLPLFPVVLVVVAAVAEDPPQGSLEPDPAGQLRGPVAGPVLVLLLLPEMPPLPLLL